MFTPDGLCLLGVGMILSLSVRVCACVCERGCITARSILSSPCQLFSPHLPSFSVISLKHIKDRITQILVVPPHVGSLKEHLSRFLNVLVGHTNYFTPLSTFDILDVFRQLAA